MGLFVLLLIVCAISSKVVAQTSFLSARVWQSLQEFPSAADFPEVEQLKNKPNTAIAFTGGGSRAYTASMGYLAGLNKLGLLGNIRYMGGISGGAWATTTFTFAQTRDDNVLLGEVLDPSAFSFEALQSMNPQCARSFASANLTLIALDALETKQVSDLPSAWAYGVSKTYLEPAGILRDKFFSWNADSVSDIVKRNRRLSAKDFQTPVNDNRAFSIIGTALVGPNAGAPYDGKTQNYTLLEITPLYVGQMKNLDVDYKYAHGITHSKRVGGIIEPFAFARNGTAPVVGIAKDHTTALLNVPTPMSSLNLEFAAAASSYAPGSFFESLPKIDEQGLHFTYWPPSAVMPFSDDVLFADGGAYENIPLISFLQRGVEKVVLFFVSSTPLTPIDQWDAFTQPYTGKQVTDCLTSFFGVFDPNQLSVVDRAMEYDKNQVFPTADFAPVITALQKSQAEGKGIFATFDLTTIENSWWGIPAGRKVQVTFSYLGRLKQWESKLPTDMYPLFVPEEDAENLSVDIKDGPFKKFPHYQTLGGDINFERANALADLTGWSVLQNEELFRAVLS
jgi:hypothetical protein